MSLYNTYVTTAKRTKRARRERGVQGRGGGRDRGTCCGAQGVRKGRKGGKLSPRTTHRIPRGLIKHQTSPLTHTHHTPLCTSFLPLTVTHLVQGQCAPLLRPRLRE
jgi:hypothetical protein